MRRIELAALLWLSLACSGSAPPTTASDGRYAMGSILEITLVGVPGDESGVLFDGFYREVERLERLASRYDETSALSRLNRGEHPGPVASELRALMALSQRYREWSGGAFDISVGAWVELWVAAAKRGRLPTPDERAHAAARTGAEAFRLGDDGRLVLAPGARLDLGAIAKGYALDRLVETLPDELHGALFNFGQSSYRAVGRPADGEAWRLLLRHPEPHPDPESDPESDPYGSFAGVVQLRDQALSISASLGQSSEIEGRRYGHIIDPRSGEPLLRNAQLAVVAPNAAMAEAVSTAALVKGREDALAWIEGLAGCEALWLEPALAEATTGWQRATRFQAEVK